MARWNADDRVDGARFQAERAADAPGLVDDGERARRLLAASCVEDELGLADIADMDRCFAFRALDRLQRLLQTRAVAVDQRNKGALFGKQHRAGPADTGAGTGHDRVPPCQSHVSFPLGAGSTKRSDRQPSQRSRTARASRTPLPAARPKVAPGRRGYACRPSPPHRHQSADK